MMELQVKLVEMLKRISIQWYIQLKINLTILKIKHM